MEITFKDVGQGDSILLEWEDDGNRKIGIIDCNKKDKKNPVAQYIEDSEYKEIEFIFLSHPHSDHYSGMVELLNVIEKKGINVLRFAHTLHLLANDYYRYLSRVEIDTEALSDLQALFDKVDLLVRQTVIRKISFLVEDVQYELMDGVTIKCLSPSRTEAKIYTDMVDLEPIKNKKAASRGANYLSTIFKITTKDKFYLLTSDSEVPTFERLVAEDSHKNLHRKEMGVCQLPHHGSSKNYHSPFWNFVTKGKEPQAVVSAGLNEKYKHPHFPVLMSFHEQGYGIHSTNIVYGMIEYVDYLKTLSATTNKLDTVSVLVSTHTGGDKKFSIN
ncbi:ComEC/Rec2 family competence protein [Mucilaginibacter angelicae]|uniref:ComEC/Rec2 family competence protein n=1 Tax=Mucilaginibacter angelicae TaxID=869718 RepID=A0ABV6L0E6_9SPHI